MSAHWPQIATAAVLALAVLAAWVRQVRRRSAAHRGRLLLHLLLQPALAALLFLGLFPPAAPVPDRALVVITPGADETAIPAAGLRVALPGAPAGIDARRVPDLATALRDHPQVSALEVHGDGLSARDRAAARGRALVFLPAPAAPGLTGIHAPAQVTIGNTFTLHGRSSGAPGSTVELIDPAGARVAQARPDADGHFAVSAIVREAGTTDFTLRLLDDDDRELERLPLPIRVVEPATLRTLVLGGAPSAELKYLRRWASDAGVELYSRIATGAGLTLGDPALALDADRLHGFDLVLLDARSLGGLPEGEFAAIGAALDDGLGVLVRLDAPPDRRTSARLATWGLAISHDGATLGTHLTAHDDEAAAMLPVLTRLQLTATGPVAPLLYDARGEALGYWSARGSGRVGLVSLLDSYRLVLAGYAARHGALWSSLFGRLARSAPDSSGPAIPWPLWPGERASLCNLQGPARVRGPDGALTELVADPRTGIRHCAAFWPDQGGWHHLQHGDAEVPFAVLPDGAGNAWRAQLQRDATRALMTLPVPAGTTVDALPTARPGSPWPWLAAWLVLATISWWLERHRRRGTA